MNKTIQTAHGAGGKKTERLISDIFKKHFDNPLLTSDDAAVLPGFEGRIVTSTDGFIVSPRFFPGGNIGRLSVCGSVNDVACMGAMPTYLTAAFVIEEGFSFDELETIVRSMAETAKEAGVVIVAGDTKVVERGQVDGLFITTTGIGTLPDGVNIAGNQARPGDAVVVTGDIGRHGSAILLAREDFGFHTDIESDDAPLAHLVRRMLTVSHRIHAIRDATRGGVGTVLYEIAKASGVGIRLMDEDLPVAPPVKSITAMLGLDPLYLACEGRLVVFVPKADADAVVAALREERYGENACVIGEVVSEHPGKVSIVTAIGTERFLSAPAGELLPRIC